MDNPNTSLVNRALNYNGDALYDFIKQGDYGSGEDFYSHLAADYLISIESYLEFISEWDKSYSLSEKKDNGKNVKNIEDSKNSEINENPEWTWEIALKNKSLNNKIQQDLKKIESTIETWDISCLKDTVFKINKHTSYSDVVLTSLVLRLIPLLDHLCDLLSLYRSRLAVVNLYDKYNTLLSEISPQRYNETGLAMLRLTSIILGEIKLIAIDDIPQEWDDKINNIENLIRSKIDSTSSSSAPSSSNSGSQNVSPVSNPIPEIPKFTNVKSLIIPQNVLENQNPSLSNIVKTKELNEPKIIIDKNENNPIKFTSPIQKIPKSFSEHSSLAIKSKSLSSVHIQEQEEQAMIEMQRLAQERLEKERLRKEWGLESDSLIPDSTMSESYSYVYNHLNRQPTSNNVNNDIEKSNLLQHDIRSEAGGVRNYRRIVSASSSIPNNLSTSVMGLGTGLSNNSNNRWSFLNDKSSKRISRALSTSSGKRKDSLLHNLLYTNQLLDINKRASQISQSPQSPITKDSVKSQNGSESGRVSLKAELPSLMSAFALLDNQTDQESGTDYYDGDSDAYESAKSHPLFSAFSDASSQASFSLAGSLVNGFKREQSSFNINNINNNKQNIATYPANIDSPIESPRSVSGTSFDKGITGEPTGEEDSKYSKLLYSNTPRSMTPSHSRHSSYNLVTSPLHDDKLSSSNLYPITSEDYQNINNNMPIAGSQYGQILDSKVQDVLLSVSKQAKLTTETLRAHTLANATNSGPSAYQTVNRAKSISGFTTSSSGAGQIRKYTFTKPDGTNHLLWVKLMNGRPMVKVSGGYIELSDWLFEYASHDAHEKLFEQGKIGSNTVNTDSFERLYWDNSPTYNELRNHFISEQERNRGLPVITEPTTGIESSNEVD